VFVRRTITALGLTALRRVPSRHLLTFRECFLTRSRLTSRDFLKYLQLLRSRLIYCPSGHLLPPREWSFDVCDPYTRSGGAHETSNDLARQ
jgi:hypothetical protein